MSTSTGDRLVPFSAQYLQQGEALPFGVRDPAGKLLLAAGQVIESKEQLAQLARQTLMALESESSDWRRRLAAALDTMVRQNAALKEIAAARPAGDGQAHRSQVAESSLPDLWEQAIARLGLCLREASTSEGWLDRIIELERAVLRQVGHRIDGSLYYLIWRAGNKSEEYAAQHAWLTSLVSRIAGELIGLDARCLGLLTRSALVMNLAMARLQDLLSSSDLPLNAAMRATIAAHATKGATELLACGAEPDLAGLVRHHHEDAGSALLPEPLKLTLSVLQRVDVFTAKLSRRRTREPLSPVSAARSACMASDGRPDLVGAAILKGLGLYPPGSFVALASGERGVVIRRGRGPNHPLVASLVAASGIALGDPVLRDTSDSRWAVKAALPASELRVIPIHTKVLALI